MKHPLRGIVALAIVAGVIGGTLGCSSGGGSSGGTAAPTDESAADVSGTLVWYTAHNPTQNDAVVAAFNEEYPNVNVEVLRLVTGELAVRYAQERDSGAPSADVITLTDQSFINSGQEKEWWDTESVAAEGFPADAVVDGVATVGVLPVLLGYNTDLIPESDAPTEWGDLLDPSLKGKILFTDPRSVPAYLALMQIWSDEYGDDFLRDLSTQDLQLVASVVPGNEALGAGAASVLVPNAAPAATTVINNGAPVAIVEVPPTTGAEFLTAVTSNAQNPDAAAAFFDFLTTKEGQEAFNAPVIVSLRDDVEGTPPLPDGFIPLNDVLPEALARQDELLSLLGIQ